MGPDATDAREMREPGVVVVTGASAGVGRAVAVAFAERGATVALLARGRDGLEAAAKDVEAAGGTALALPTDVADHAEVEAAAARVEAEAGPIDLWINNAMTTVFAPVWEVEPEEFARATEVTYLGQVYGTLAALRRMRARDRGTIVNVGSALAFRGIPLQSAYCGAKFAVRGFTDSLQSELIADGSNVRLATVHLPAVNTPQFGWCRSKLPMHPQPVAPIYEPEAAAAEIVASALSGRRRKTMGGWNWVLVQFARHTPGILDHYLARAGVDSQQTSIPAAPDRADNLFEPVDGVGGGDHGAEGIFGARANGFLDPFFLMTLPKTMLDFAGAVGDWFRERGRGLRPPG